VIEPTILITGVGGGVGQSIIKSLQESQFRLIGVDGETLGTGLYTVDKAYRVPYANDPGYVDRLLEICEIEKCSLIFPGLDAELIPLGAHATHFTEFGVTPVVSPADVIRTGDNKYATALFLQKNGFPAPQTQLVTDNLLDKLGFPFVLKPLEGGARSKGVYIIEEEQELKYRLSTIDNDNYVAQEYIQGDEYTCGSINFDGICHGVIVMRRILRDGDTYKAFVINDAQLENFVRDVAEALKPFGPCNFQLRVRDGTPFIFEINPRCSGTTYSRTLAGFNEPLMTAEYLLMGKKPNFKIKEATIFRYWKEILIENDRIGKLDERGELDGNGSKL
jgi:carbamoyl-phosphate synthase large subunit